MKEKDILAIVEQVATELGQSSADAIAPDSVISELGIDSLAMGRIVVDLEQRLKITIPDGELLDIVTVDDLIRIVEHQLADSSPALLDVTKSRQ